MAINKANFHIQKSHLQDGKIQISQSLFAIWMAFLLPYWPIIAYRLIWISNMGYPYRPIWAYRPISISHIRYPYRPIWAYRPIWISNIRYPYRSICTYRPISISDIQYPYILGLNRLFGRSNPTDRSFLPERPFGVVPTFFFTKLCKFLPET